MRYNGDFNPVDDLFDKQNSNQNNSLNTSVPNIQNTDSVIQENNESWQNNNVTNTNYNQSIIKDNMINNENINNDINDIQYNQNNNKRGFNKSIIYAIVGFILFIAVGIVITNLVLKIIEQKKANEEEIAVLTDYLNVKAVGFDFDQPFDKNKFEYNLEIDTQKVQFKCNKIDSVTGCNETVNLVNKTNLDHIIEYTSQKGKKYSYTFHIIKKDTNGPIKIDSIEFEKTDYSNKSTTVVVKANSDKNKKLKYSFDGGNTWQDDNKYTTDENEDVNVVIKDDAGNTTDPKEIEIDNIDTVAPTVSIEEKEKSSNKVVLFANAKDDSSGIDKYNWNESGYTNNSTYEATKAGTYTVKVKDKAGNESVKASITIPESYFKKNVKKETHTYKVKFDGNGASVTKGELSCSTTGLSCKIKLPEIKRDNGIIIGYSENANATTPQYKVGQEISVTENKTLYAITAKKITLTINGNGATVKDTEKKCYIYNKKTSCKITTPMISRSGYSIIGFNEDAQAHTEKYKVSSNLNIDKDKTIYAITSKKMTAIFDGNGATISNKNATCNIYNTEKTCSVSIPQITRNGWTIFGVSSNKNSHTAIPAKTVEAGKTYYAITSKKMVATFEGNGATVSNKSVSCYVYNTAETCSVSIPQITRKGWTVLGVSSNKNSHTAIPAKTVEAGKTYYAITNKKLTLTVNGNGASVSKSGVTCNIYNNDKSCKVTTPTITRSGYSIIVFNSKASATSSEYKINSSITLDKDKTIYAITSKKLIATFKGNGAKVTKSSVTCNVYNNDKTCKVTTPAITRSGYSIIGFNSKASATSSEYKINSSITLDKDKTIYAITSKKLTATFKENGASVSKTSVTCNIYNTGKTCNVTAPTITRSGWSILGFSTNKNATTGSTEKTLVSDKTYYAITKKNIKVTFTENNNKNTYPKAIKNKKAMQVKFDYIEYREAFCSIYNTQTSCKIKIPFVDVKGLASSGFSPGIDEKTGPGSPKTVPNTLDYELAPHYITGNTYSFSKSTTLYAVFETLDYYRDFRSTIEHTLTYTSSTGRIIIDIEKGCSRDHYKKYFDEIKNSKFKFLLDGNAKIMVLTNDSMKKVHPGQDGDVAGVSFSLTGAGYYHYNISLNCKYDSDKYDYLTFYTIIHELSHRWDARYYLATGTTLNSKFTSFYNKYKSNNSWPIRDYGKGSLGEFFGVIVDEYYMNYIANTNLHPIPYDRKKGLYPSDLKKALETYINNPKNANF